MSATTCDHAEWMWRRCDACGRGDAAPERADLLIALASVLGTFDPSAIAHEGDDVDCLTLWWEGEAVLTTSVGALRRAHALLANAGRCKRSET